MKQINGCDRPVLKKTRERERVKEAGTLRIMSFYRER